MEVSREQDSSPLVKCELSYFLRLMMHHYWETSVAAQIMAMLFN
jgi:hypothetical protein